MKQRFKISNFIPKTQDEMHNGRATPLKQRFYQTAYNKKNIARKTIGFIDTKRMG